MKVIDIHCHVIPRVDDGPDTVEEAKRLLTAMREEGVYMMIATPHYRPGMFETPGDTIEKYYRIAKRASEKRGMRMYLGCEFYRGAELPEAIKDGKGATMAGTDYVLVEFAPEDLFLTIRNQVCTLVMQGYQPIVAHVERYECCREPERVRELRELGAYIQVNAGAVLGQSGWKAKRYVKKLMIEDLVDFIASDAHDRNRRKPNLGLCAAYVERKFGRRYAQRIFVKNPLNILKNRRTL